MKNIKIALIAVTLMVFCTAAVTNVVAQNRSRKTTITFSQPVEIPGQILPAGTYVFKLADSESTRNIVQVFNADETHQLATILAINNYRVRPTGATVVKFAETSGDQPQALKAWFYPGDNYGQEFAYPKHRAIELEAVVHEPVPSYPDNTSAETMNNAPITPIDDSTAPVVATPPTATTTSAPPVPEDTTPAPAPTPSVASDSTPAPATTSTEPVTMPQTGSSVPLIALLGLASLGIAAGIKRSANY